MTCEERQAAAAAEVATWPAMTDEQVETVVTLLRPEVDQQVAS